MDTQIAPTRVYYRFEEIDGETEIEGPIEMAPAPPNLSILEPDQPKLGFWRRQFGDQVTARQRRWDWAFGVILPLVCFYFDPIVFRNFAGGEGDLLPRFQVPVYVLAYGSIMALSAWLLWGEKLGPSKLAVGWIMAAGAFMASVLGAILFPFALIGSFFLIGILGFTPIFTAIIYWRNAIRAFRASERTTE